MELVVAGHLLGQRAAIVLVDDEIPDQEEQPFGFTDSGKHHLKLRDVIVNRILTGDRSPGLEPLPAGGERADPGFRAVGDDQQLIEGEERRDVRLVSLELLPGALDGGVLVGRILEFDDAQREAVYEQHDVGSVRVLPLLDRELIDGEPVVGGGDRRSR